MNALEQARNLLAQQTDNSKCTVEEVLNDEAPVAEPIEETTHTPGAYANTIVLLDRITLETLVLDGILRHYDTQFINIVNRTETLMDDIYKVLDAQNQGVDYTQIVTNFASLSIEQFQSLLARYPALTITFVGSEEQTLADVVFNSIAVPARTSYSRVEGSLTMQIASVLPFRERFATEETYTAFLTNTEFQENIAFIAKNEYSYYKNKMVDFVNARLLTASSPTDINQVLLAYKISQINRFTNNHTLFANNTIVSDYSYNDVLEYTNYLTALTSSDDENKKVYANANALVCFVQNYEKNESNVTIVSWSDVRTAELRSRIGDCGHQTLNSDNSVSVLTVKFAGSQQEFLAKYIAGNNNNN
jgi:hypothetical protein